MSNYQSKHTGQEIDAGIDATAKIPTLENAITNVPENFPIASATTAGKLYVHFNAETQTLYFGTSPITGV